MENTKYKLVACDLDGTLLGENQRVSRENLEAIAEMHRRGVEFVPTTGRALCEFPEELIDCPSVRYVITSNGATIIDKNSGKVTFSEYLSDEAIKFIFEILDAYTAYPIIHANGHSYYDRSRHSKEYTKKCRLSEYFREIIETYNTPLDNFREYITDLGKVEMLCIFFGTEEELRISEKMMLDSKHFAVAQSGAANLEVYSSKAGKGATLAALASGLGISIDQTIAAGDSKNDTTLLKTAGLSLAMENAHEELKALADKVICHNSEHCAKYILDNFLSQD